MKRTLAITLLGIATATTAVAQGDFRFSNYNVAPPSPISFLGVAVPTADVQVGVWGAAGAGQTSESLAFLGNANWSGYAGYTSPTQVFRIPALDYVAGSTWTFQLRAAGNIGGVPVIGSGPLVVSSAIANQGVIPPEVALTVINTPGFALQEVIIPEPSTFALAGLGAAALLIFRRRS